MVYKYSMLKMAETKLVRPQIPATHNHPRRLQDPELWRLFLLEPWVHESTRICRNECFSCESWLLFMESHAKQKLQAVEALAETVWFCVSINVGSTADLRYKIVPLATRGIDKQEWLPQVISYNAPMKLLSWIPVPYPHSEKTLGSMAISLPAFSCTEYLWAQKLKKQKNRCNETTSGITFGSACSREFCICLALWILPTVAPGCHSSLSDCPGPLPPSPERFANGPCLTQLPILICEQICPNNVFI